VNVHKNAKLAPAGRALLVRRVVVSRERRAAVAAAFGVSARTVGKWVARWQYEGPPGLVDRSSRPRRSPRQVAPRLVRRVERLRRRRWTSPAIATALGLPVSTVGRVLRRLGLNRLRGLDPRPVVVRYEKRVPGELVHIDAKRLARFTRVGHRIHGDRERRSRRVGWEHVHVCIDDATRLAYAEISPAEDGASAAAFLHRATGWLARLGVGVQRVMTDNASAYLSRVYRAATAAQGVRHIRTRPYTPRTNGKAERFIQTCLREWVYVRSYRSSAVRNAALPAFLRHYNMERPHTALQRRPPLARLLELSEQRA
jgi:transposase InsO family protein